MKLVRTIKYLSIAKMIPVNEPLPTQSEWNEQFRKLVEKKFPRSHSVAISSGLSLCSFPYDGAQAQTHWSAVATAKAFMKYSEEK